MVLPDFGSERVRWVMETADAFDREGWQAMADAGLVGRHLRCDPGGRGGSAVELGALMEALGGTLACVPMLSAAMAMTALTESGDDEAQHDWLASIGNGTTVATVAVTGDRGQWVPSAVAAIAERKGPVESPWRVSGHAAYVVDGPIADIFLVVALTGTPAGAPGPDDWSGDGFSLMLVKAGAPGLTVTAPETLDPTRRLARLELDGVPARLVGVEGGGAPVVRRVLQWGAVALAAEQSGGAARCLAMSVDYARRREQFGRPIGSFQAIAHRCAEMLLEVESARTAARHACRALDASPDDAETAVAMAKACCSDAFAWVATETIQVHGGVGFTWDHDAHLFFRRAKSSRLLFGDPRHHREIVARSLGI